MTIIYSCKSACKRPCDVCDWKKDVDSFAERFKKKPFSRQ